ncbi:unnamed protein product [Brassica rapa]|uniref:Uncharacterized protein n=1 Tax=Brassica campestris TaxID=3711 RepID=A0A3P6DGS5_BRACM|nr:unnamed protein product [Brassica rapa]VDD18339.1 unnamed protein product [Brassica rapa]
MRDFNEITCYPQRELEAREEKAYLSFLIREIKCHGQKKSCGYVWCHLNQILGNEDWHEKFSHIKVQYLRMRGQIIVQYLQISCPYQPEKKKFQI